MPILWPEVDVDPDYESDDMLTWHVPVSPAGLAGVVYEMSRPALLSGRLTSHVWYPQTGSAHLQLSVRADETDEVAQALDELVTLTEQTRVNEVAERTAALEREAAEERAAAASSPSNELAAKISARLRDRGRG